MPMTCRGVCFRIGIDSRAGNDKRAGIDSRAPDARGFATGAAPTGATWRGGGATGGAIGSRAASMTRMISASGSTASSRRTVSACACACETEPRDHRPA